MCLSVLLFFLLFIHFTFDVTVLSFFISFFLLWLWLYQILDFKIKFKIFFFTYLDSQIVGNGNCVPVSTCHPHLWTCSYHVWVHLHLCWPGECSDRQCLQGTLLPSSWMPSSKTIKKRDDSFNTFFSYIDSGKHGPRAVYVEPIVIDKLCTGTYHQLLHTEVQQLSITMPMATIPSPKRSLTLS